MRLLLPICAFLTFFSSTAQNEFPPVGMWREHLPYNSAIDVASSNSIVFCATPYSLFTVDLEDNSIRRYSKVSGLSETGISTIAYDNIAERLVIAYSNSNIDLLTQSGVINIPDIKRDNIAGDKTIYNIYPYNKYYYLSSGLGVFVVDGDKHEIKDSWFIGNNGAQVKVNGFVVANNFFYAATEEGLKRSSTSTTNPADFTNWQLISGTNGLPVGSCQNIIYAGDKLIAMHNDSLFVQNGSTWSLFYGDEWPAVSVNSSGGSIQLCQRKLNGDSRVLILNTNGTIQRTIQQPAVISFPKKAIQHQNNFWVADMFGGLSTHNSQTSTVYKPNSPEATASGELTVDENVFYATAGEVNESWNYQYNGNGIFRFKEGVWKNYNRFVYPQLDSMLDFITIAVDPRDKSVWAGSFGGGLLHIKTDESFEIFKQNSPISEMVGDPGSYRVSGLAFDTDNNLWVANYGAERALHVRKNDGSWKSFAIPFTLSGNPVSQIIIDQSNQKWIVSPLGNGLIVFNHGSSVESEADDRWTIYRAGTSSGNLPNSDVLSIALDKNGFVWVGTTDGIGVIQCPQDVFANQGCPAFWPVVEEGNFAGYLFKGEEVRSIAVDGADRKWVATRNGVWLISANGENVIYRFTEDNSPLLSNDVRKITIDDQTGEVFFATLKGICSFRSTATKGGEKNESVLVFPNPVPPGYAGTIVIRGLVNNAIVKITELDGRLVYQGRSLGGQFVWDGKDYKGRRISSGVYLVLVSDETKTEKIASKIVFISK